VDNIECTVNRYNNNNDIISYRFQNVCGTIQHTFKTSNEEYFLKLYKIMAVPTLLQGRENLNLMKQHERTETAEMKILRSVAEYTLYDCKKNKDIRGKLNLYNLNEIIMDCISVKWVFIFINSLTVMFMYVFFFMAQQPYMGLGLLISSRFHDHTL
jgi:hypothetical protein